MARALLGAVFKRSAIAYTAVAKLQLVPEMIRLMVSKAHRKLLVFFERIWTAEQGQDDLVRQNGRLDPQVAGSAGVVASGYDPIWCKLFHSEMKDFERDAALAEFRNIGPSALLACRALDEGLDVPTVDGAILVASTQSARQRLQRIGRTLRRGDGNKRPLIVLLYVKGTNDESVRIHPDDPDFKDAAKVYDAEPKQCVERISELVGLQAMKPVVPPAGLGQGASANLSWKVAASGPAEVGRVLRQTRRGVVVQLTLATGKLLTGKFSAMLDDVIMLSEPASQTTIRNVAEVRTAC